MAFSRSPSTVIFHQRKYALLIDDFPDLEVFGPINFLENTKI
ncbi:hypothetical protein AC229_0985 [Oenococcus oeni]|nr:hypothetical protein AC229_0985 [Oenococcus oeni]